MRCTIYDVRCTIYGDARFAREREVWAGAQVQRKYNAASPDSYWGGSNMQPRMTHDQIRNLESDLWEAAAEYKDPLLGLVLLPFAENRYEDAAAELAGGLSIRLHRGGGDSLGT